MSRTHSVFVLGFLFAAACGGSLPQPTLVAHQPAEFTEVPYPPPAALVELVPESPVENAVWVDGEWTFQGRFYVWQRGNWVVAPPGSRFAAWRSMYTEDGRLLLAPGTWYDARGRRIDAPEAVANAATPANEFTPETLTAR